MTDPDRWDLVPGDWVEVRRDDGRTTHHKVKYAPGRLPSGEPVVWLHGIAGCFLLDRVVGRDAGHLPTSADEIARLRAGLELIAQVVAVSGSAQSAFRMNVRTAAAVLAGADVRELAVVEAIAAGTWKPGDA